MKQEQSIGKGLEQHRFVPLHNGPLHQQSLTMPDTFDSTDRLAAHLPACVHTYMTCYHRNMLRQFDVTGQCVVSPHTSVVTWQQTGACAPGCIVIGPQSRNPNRAETLKRSQLHINSSMEDSQPSGTGAWLSEAFVIKFYCVVL